MHSKNKTMLRQTKPKSKLWGFAKHCVVVGIAFWGVNNKTLRLVFFGNEDILCRADMLQKPKNHCLLFYSKPKESWWRTETSKHTTRDNANNTQVLTKPNLSLRVFFWLFDVFLFCCFPAKTIHPKTLSVCSFYSTNKGTEGKPNKARATWENQQAQDVWQHLSRVACFYECDVLVLRFIVVIFPATSAKHFMFL